MKKFLLTLAALAIAAMPMSAVEFQKSARVQGAPRTAKFQKAKKIQHAPLTDGYELRFCGAINNWHALTQTSIPLLRFYIHIDADLATKLAGNKLTEITFSTSVDVPTSGYVFVTEDLDGTPASQTNLDFIDCYTTAPYYQTVALEQPYEIKAGQGFWFGYAMINSTSQTWPLGIDAETSSPYCGFVDKGTTSTQTSVEEMSGTNLFCYAKTEGPVKAIENLFSVVDAAIGMFTCPTFIKGEEMPVLLSLDNYGENALTSISYSVTIDGTTTDFDDQAIDVPSNSGKVMILPAPKAEKEGRSYATLTIKSVNGVAASATFSNKPYFVADASKVYNRRFVAEEATSTRCGYCPVGIVCFENMTKNFPESFIGIAVHSPGMDGNLAAQKDPMVVDSYSDFTDVMASLPSSVLNRDPLYGNVYPAYYYYSQYIGPFTANKGIAEVVVDVEQPADGATTMKASATTTFAISQTNSDYALAFVILEDGISATQLNNYSGKTEAAADVDNYGDWPKKKQSVTWSFEHVARDIFYFDGINSSIPADIVAGEPYTYSFNLPLTNVKKVENTKVVALLLDKETGVILNAGKSDDPKSGIADKLVASAKANVRAAKGAIVVEGDYTSATVYSLAGHAVTAISGGKAAVAPGLYIVNVDGHATKLLVK